MTTTPAPPTAPAALPEALRALSALVLGRAEPGPVRRVAVVGNAPMAPSPERARRIDDASLVVRMTTFALDTDLPVAGHRADVVVVHRALRPGPDTFADYASRVTLLAEPGRRHGEPEALPTWWPADLAAVPIPNREVTDPLVRRLRLGGAAATWPTTGTLTIALMHALFPGVPIESFGSSILRRRRPRGTLEHAWGESVALTPEHRLGAEARLVRAWIAEGWLRVPE